MMLAQLAAVVGGGVVVVPPPPPPPPPPRASAALGTTSMSAAAASAAQLVLLNMIFSAGGLGTAAEDRRGAVALTRGHWSYDRVTPRAWRACRASRRGCRGSGWP